MAWNRKRQLQSASESLLNNFELKKKERKKIDDFARLATCRCGTQRWSLATLTVFSPMKLENHW